MPLPTPMAMSKTSPRPLREALRTRMVRSNEESGQPLAGFTWGRGWAGDVQDCGGDGGGICALHQGICDGLGRAIHAAFEDRLMVPDDAHGLIEVEELVGEAKGKLWEV